MMLLINLNLALLLGLAGAMLLVDAVETWRDSFGLPY